MENILMSIFREIDFEGRNPCNSLQKVWEAFKSFPKYEVWYAGLHISCGLPEGAESICLFRDELGNGVYLVSTGKDTLFQFEI